MKKALFFLIASLLLNTMGVELAFHNNELSSKQPTEEVLEIHYKNHQLNQEKRESHKKEKHFLYATDYPILLTLSTQDRVPFLQSIPLYLKHQSILI